MIESEVVNEWIAKGRVAQAITLVLGAIEVKFGKVPPELEATIRNTSDLPRLETWNIQAAKAATLDAFRTVAEI